MSGCARRVSGSCYDATSAVGGSYSVAVAPSDTYQVEFYDYDNVYASGRYASSVPTTHYTSDFSSATDVAVGTPDVTGINITLPLAGATYVPLAPIRLLDTRTGNGVSGPFVIGTPRTFQVTGRGGVPPTRSPSPESSP